MQGIKQRINNVILTGQGITNINKSDVAGKIALNIPVKISTGRLISTVRPEYRTAYALVRYISSRAFAKNVSSSIETKSNENILHSILEHKRSGIRGHSRSRKSDIKYKTSEFRQLI